MTCTDAAMCMGVEVRSFDGAQILYGLYAFDGAPSLS